MGKDKVKVEGVMDVALKVAQKKDKEKFALEVEWRRVEQAARTEPPSSPLKKSSRAALLRKSQTLTYAKYASGLTFSRVLPASFLNGLQESTLSTGC